MNVSTLDTRWKAVMTRDPRADGKFLIGVKSTKIYCRPSCPARHPRRENVTFFDDSAKARALGYRACRRCKPDDPNADSKQILVQRICRFIDRHDGEAPTLERIAREFGFSPHYLQRTFKSALGVSPKQYASTRRMQSLRQRLRNGESVTRALYNSGFGSSSRLYENGKTQLGMTPGTYRRAGGGEILSYAIVPTMLGNMLVARTERGVCEVRFGNDDGALANQLRTDYQAAKVERDDGHLRPIVQSIVSHLDRGSPIIDIDRDVQATAFQHRVWRALSAIPYGQTRTYGEIAQVIGKPGAARAVGRACGSNKLPLIIPCHRAVGKRKASGGYRWGMPRKRKLLMNERGLAHRSSKRAT